MFMRVPATRRISGSVSRGRRICKVLVAGVGCLWLATAAQADQLGTVTGLPLPRYVSLKSDRVNLREGPSKDHRTSWVFQRAGLPVEITAEFDTWRKIRDSDGSEGWVLHSLLSGRRTALVAPWKKDVVLPLVARPADDSRALANLQPGVLANVKRCDGTWCRVFGDGFDGYMKQTSLWGVYPDEHID
jgi:SH3-like domain-containing protein